MIYIELTKKILRILEFFFLENGWFHGYSANWPEFPRFSRIPWTIIYYFFKKIVTFLKIRGAGNFNYLLCADWMELVTIKIKGKKWMKMIKFRWSVTVQAEYLNCFVRKSWKCRSADDWNLLPERYFINPKRATDVFLLEAVHHDGNASAARWRH